MNPTLDAYQADGAEPINPAGKRSERLPPLTESSQKAITVLADRVDDTTGNRRRLDARAQ